EGAPNARRGAWGAGRPVVATRVFGSPEVVRDDAVGLLVDTPEPPLVAQALRELLSHPRDRTEVRRYAEHHSWARTVDGMEELFEQLLAGRNSKVGAGS